MSLHLSNLGPKSEEMLNAAGIDVARLRAQGSVQCYLEVKRAGMPASLNLLWALEGALTGRDWRTVAREDKLRLLAELDARERTG